MYFDYGNYLNVGQAKAYEGILKREKLDDALPKMSYSDPILKFQRTPESGVGISPCGSALAQIGAFASGLPVQSPETTQRVSMDVCRYLDVYPYA